MRARAWVEAWNRQDLDAILSHYAPDVEFTSPFVARLLGDPTGIVRGREALRAYFAGALEAYPELRFEFFQVFAGVDSLVVYYRSVRGLYAAEMMALDGEGQVARVLAHYSERPPDGAPGS